MNKVDLEKIQIIAVTTAIFSMSIFTLVGAVALAMMLFDAS